jgi:hypothetical protein
MCRHQGCYPSLREHQKIHLPTIKLITSGIFLAPSNPKKIHLPTTKVIPSQLKLFCLDKYTCTL